MKLLAKRRTVFMRNAVWVSEDWWCKADKEAVKQIAKGMSGVGGIGGAARSTNAVVTQGNGLALNFKNNPNIVTTHCYRVTWNFSCSINAQQVQHSCRNTITILTRKSLYRFSFISLELCVVICLLNSWQNQFGIVHIYVWF